jgi:hypothetical protein
MARKFGTAKKGKFDDLPTEFKDAVAQSSPEDIKKRIAGIAIEAAELETAKEKDQDYQDKKKVASEAGAIYRDGKKGARLRTAYCLQVLKDKGAA